MASNSTKLTMWCTLLAYSTAWMDLISLFVCRSRAKNAQEAHEAIRPTSAAPTSGLGGVAERLYQLVRGRTLSSQMANASIRQARVC